MADSEVRQKFETIRTEHTAPFCWCGINHNQMFRMPSVTDWAQGYVSCPEYDEAYSAGMRAGEIAMREKTKGLCNVVAELLPYEHREIPRMIVRKIGELPLSGAEESKKEQP